MAKKKVVSLTETEKMPSVVLREKLMNWIFDLLTPVGSPTEEQGEVGPG